MKKTFGLLLLFLLVIGFATAQVSTPKPIGPIPTENQLSWQEMEYYAFIHFSTNTFTNQEWGYGAPEDAKSFNPTNLDCEQWASVCKNAGMKGIIITAKHHSGFCLWPTETTDYSVKNSPWKDGKGDIVGDLAKACKKYGLKLGIYISPWDRNNSSYGLLDSDGSAPYVKNIFRKQIEECLTQYGPIFEIWFDGANGGDGFYGGANTSRRIDRKTYYDWQNTYQLIRKIQPNCMIWNDNGDRADLRWVGTESGYVGETNWSLLNKTGDVPENMLRYGVENGDAWVPGEVNTSIRPGWFYHENEDSRVKDLPKLMETYYKAIGRNGTFLLNFPIDKRGLIHEVDAKNSFALAQAVKQAFAHDLARNATVTASSVRGNSSSKFAASNVNDGKKDTYWATDDGVITASLVLDFGKEIPFNRFLAQEYITLGQRIKSFKLEALVNGNWVELKDQLVPNGNALTTIGYKRIICFPTVIATKLRFTILDSKACPVISNISVYNAPPLLSSSVLLSDELVKMERRNAVKKDWKIIGTTDPKAMAVLDGNPSTAWYQETNVKMPIDLVVDMGKVEPITGFQYLPSPNRNVGCITNYQFFVSTDNNHWKLVDKGEFSNIANNPILQTKNFKLEYARYFKLSAIKNALGNNAAGYAEIDVITN